MSMLRAFAVGIVLLASISPAQAFDVTGCNQTVPAGEIGVLQADLDCPATEVGVKLERNARLLLNGHGIRGGLEGITARGPGAFRVLGPGEVSGAQNGCIDGFLDPEDEGRKVSLSVWDVTVAGCPLVGISASRLDLRNVTVVETGVVDTVANTWSGMGVSAGSVRIRDSLVERNALGLRSTRNLKMLRVTVRDNRGGVATSEGSVTAIGSVVTGNWTDGIAAGGAFHPAAIYLRDSIVDGNALGGDYRDLVSARAVRLRNSICGTSGKIVYDSTADTTVIRGTWGICTDD